MSGSSDRPLLRRLSDYELALERDSSLYERLGFDRVGEVCDFLRKPPQLQH